MRLCLCSVLYHRHFYSQDYRGGFVCMRERERGLSSHLFDAAFEFKSQALISTCPSSLLRPESAVVVTSHHVPSSRLLSSPAPSSPLTPCLGQTRIAAVFIELRFNEWPILWKLSRGFDRGLLERPVFQRPSVGIEEGLHCIILHVWMMSAPVTSAFL